MTGQTLSKATGLIYLELQENLQRLKLTQAISALDRLAEEAAQRQLSPQPYHPLHLAY